MKNDLTFPEFTPISDSLIDELLDRPETLKAVAKAISASSIHSFANGGEHLAKAAPITELRG